MRAAGRGARSVAGRLGASSSSASVAAPTARPASSSTSLPRLLLRLPSQQPQPQQLKRTVLRAAAFSSSSSADRSDAEPQVRPKSSAPLTQRVLQLFGYGDSLKRTKNSEALLQSCIAQANNTAFYRAGRISDAFRSSHGLLMVHVWMLHKRLLMEGEEGKVLEEALFDRLWEETTSRIRALKVNELSVNSYLKEVQAYSFGACVSYDASQAIEDEAERVDELAGALYRYVYLRDEHLTEDHVLELAKYVQRELDSLKKIPKAAIFESRFKWGPLPAWNPHKKRLPRYVTSQGRQLTDAEVLGDQQPSAEAAPEGSATASAGEGEGEGKGAKEEEEEEAEEAEEGNGGDPRGEWRTAFSETGRMYYWNVRTRESSWDKPY